MPPSKAFGKRPDTNKNSPDSRAGDLSETAVEDKHVQSKVKGSKQLRASPRHKL